MRFTHVRGQHIALRVHVTEYVDRSRCGDGHYTPNFWEDQHWNAILYPEQQIVDANHEMVVAFGLHEESVFHEFCSHFGGMVWCPQFISYGIQPPLTWHGFSEETWEVSLDEHAAWLGSLETYEVNGNTVLLRNDGATAVYFPTSNRLLEIGKFEDFIQRFLVDGELIHHINEFNE